MLRFTVDVICFCLQKLLDEPWSSFILFPNEIKIKYGSWFKFYFLKNQKPLRRITSLPVKVNQSLCRPISGPEGSRRLRLPDFKTIDTWRWWGCQPEAPAAFTPQEIFLILISVRGWTHFLDRTNSPWARSVHSTSPPHFYIHFNIIIPFVSSCRKRFAADFYTFRISPCFQRTQIISFFS